jgi:hypothetical protein
MTIKLGWTLLCNKNIVVSTILKINLNFFILMFNKMITNLHVAISHFLISK